MTNVVFMDPINHVVVH